MTAPTMGMDSAALEALRRGDEQAFERFFRSSYAGLLTEAKTQLGAEATGAGRVVERVFARIWQERQSFATPEALDSFVHGAMHDVAVRERSRMGALHRFEANERVHGGGAAKHADPTVDEAWTHVQHQIHAGGAGSKEIREQSRARGSHEAAAHMASIAKKRSWVLPVAGVVVTGAVIIGVISYLAKGSSNAALTNGLIASDAKNFTTGSAQISNIELNDGTKVKLAPESRLRVPQKFGNAIHGARIDGTAQFTAALQASNPLEIRAGRASIFLTSGVADVMTDSTRGTVVLRMREGDATVRLGNNETRTVAAGSALALDSATVTTPSAADIEEATGWADGRVTINNRPLRATLASIKRWWGLELYLKDTSAFSRAVSMSANLDSPKEAIASLEQGGQLKFGYEGKNMILTDAPAAKKGAVPAPKQAAKK